MMHEDRAKRDRVRIILVEDDLLFRDLLKRACEQAGDVEVVGTFAAGEEAVSTLSARRDVEVDVAVLDIQLGGNVNGLQTAYQLRLVRPGLGVLLLSNHRVPAYLSALKAFDLRGVSYLLKRTVSDFDALHRAIIGTAEGSIVVDRSLVEGAVSPEGRVGKLSARQQEILQLVAQGYSNSAIADLLNLSRRTVENHLLRTYRDLDISVSDDVLLPRVQAVLAYLADRYPGQLDELRAPS